MVCGTAQRSTGEGEGLEGEFISFAELPLRFCKSYSVFCSKLFFIKFFFFAIMVPVFGRTRLAALVWSATQLGFIETVLYLLSKIDVP